MRRTARRQEVFDRARELGVTIDEDTGFEITVTAPKGHIITLTGKHSQTCIWDLAYAEMKAGAWARVLQALSAGVRPCLAAQNCYCRKEPT